MTARTAGSRPAAPAGAARITVWREGLWRWRFEATAPERVSLASSESYLDAAGAAAAASAAYPGVPVRVLNGTSAARRRVRWLAPVAALAGSWFGWRYVRRRERHCGTAR